MRCVNSKQRILIYSTYLLAEFCSEKGVKGETSNGVKCVGEFGAVPASGLTAALHFLWLSFSTNWWQRRPWPALPRTVLPCSALPALSCLTDRLTDPLDNRKLLLLLCYCCSFCVLRQLPPSLRISIQIRISLFAAFVLLFRSCFGHSKDNSKFSFKNVKS